MSVLTKFTLRQLFEGGVHFGHHTRRWNPKMRPFIYGEREKIHIINLEETVIYLKKALDAVRQVASQGGRILFVGTKPQASKPIKDAALRCGQYYVNHRWLGGTLTNWGTISKSIKRLKELKAQIDSGEIKQYTKKEQLSFERQHAKLEASLGGIKDMGNLPDLIFVIDTQQEKNAILEANRLKIPVVAIVDTNSDPSHVTYPVPGNDDALRSIQLYCQLVSGAVVEGVQEEMLSKGIDIGASLEPAPVLEEKITVSEDSEKGTIDA